MRLIDADAKIEAQLYDDEHEEWILKEMTIAGYLSFSDSSIPFVDAIPVRHGHWIKVKYPLFTCSECGATYQDIGYGYNYCPNCGAKMEKNL